MNLRAAAANLVWAGGLVRAWRRFRSALASPERHQRQLLIGLLRENANTAFGERHGFAGILSASDVIGAYQSEVQVTDYNAMEPWILRVTAGETSVLTHSAVTRLTPSSGSTSAAKLLPHTDRLQREFARAVDAWIADLYIGHPRLAGGPAYWSITPALSFETIAAARLGPSRRHPSIPIGFEDDSAYLGGLRQRLVSAILAVPADVRRISDPETFRYVTLLFLLRARDLRLISVWHPSFLVQLLEAVPSHLGRIVEDLARGTLNPPGRIPEDVRQALLGKLRPMPRRAAELHALRSLAPQMLWPDLALVSCWGDGPARSYARRLSQIVPGVAVQPKGLIATEAMVSIPFGGQHPLAVGSHFFEFLDERGRCRLAHELDRHSQYTVVVTTGGGLYRYNLGDRILVTGFADSTPSVEFVGRADRVSDRFGEKLSDGFVTSVMDELFAQLPVPRFAMLAPERTTTGTAYTLLVEPDGHLPGGLDVVLERCLRRNPHYAWCVDLGQLQPARLVRVGPDAARLYLETCAARGQRLGDVKPLSLHTDGGWERALRVSGGAELVE